MLKKAEKTSVPYIRVGTDYFKVINKKDRDGIERPELKKWNKDEIKLDHGNQHLYQIPKFDDFIMSPDNDNYKNVVENCYNMYHPFVHKPINGSWKWTEILLKHIFGDQYELGIKYLQVLYKYPRQALPVLALVSKERQTGKSTFLDWLSAIFGANMILINPEDISSSFNGVYATSNIIAIEETLIDKSSSVEKIKALSTQKTITVNIKNVQQFKLPFFGKIILASNNENKFIKVDDEEIRFFVRKLGTPKISNHNILNDMISEIPAFLNYLSTLEKPDFTKSRMIFTPDELKNDTLKRVKSESKNWLYKDLIQQFEDYFLNQGNNTDEIKVIPKDLKEYFYLNNHQVSNDYLKTVLEDDFGLVKEEKIIRYEKLNGESKTGKPYTINRSLFVGDNEEGFSYKNFLVNRIDQLQLELSQLENGENEDGAIF